MDLIYRWCQSNLDVTLLLYGLAFVTIGVAILVHLKKETEFKLADTMWLFVAYAFIHSLSDFLDMFRMTKGENQTFI